MSSSFWRVKKTCCFLFLLSSSFSHLPTMVSLPQGRLIKTNAIAGYHCYAGAQRAAGSYFSFALVWWCDFVFFRNRFVSNGSVYLSSLSPLSLFPLCKGEDGVLWVALSHYLESADFRAVPNRANFPPHIWHFLDAMQALHSSQDTFEANTAGCADCDRINWCDAVQNETKQS